MHRPYVVYRPADLQPVGEDSAKQTGLFCGDFAKVSFTHFMTFDFIFHLIGHFVIYLKKIIITFSL